MNKKKGDSKGSTKPGKADGARVRKEIVRNPLVPLKGTSVKTVNIELNVEEIPRCSTAGETSTKRDRKTESGDSHGNPRKSKDKDPPDKPQDEFKRVNIPFSEKKYRGLVDLGSLEGALSENPDTNKRRACLPQRDPQPTLHDYYQPKFDTEYVFSFPPPPVKISKEWSYNPRSVSDILDQIEKSC